MSVKIFIVFLCAAIGTAAGFALSKMFLRTSRYYAAVCELIAELKRNISYRRDTVVSVMKNFKSQSDRLNNQIGEYVSYVSTKDGELKLSRGFLSTAAFSEVNSFFSSLGKADGDTQVNDLDMFYSKFESLASGAADRSKKYGPLSIKLGFLFGLCVGILFL